MNVGIDCIIFLISAAWVLFNFYLNRKQRIQSGTLQKFLPPSPSMKEFCLDIEK